MFLSVVLSRLVLFCSCYVFIVCLISFASYIITSYMDDVRLSHLNKDYLLTYLLTYHFTNGRLKSIFNSIILTYFRLFTLSQKKKMLPPYPPHLKNVTALPCEMLNFIISRKVMLRSSKRWWLWKEQVVGWHRCLWKELVLMCDNWNVRQATFCVPFTCMY